MTEVTKKANIEQRLHAVMVAVEYVKRQNVPSSGTGVYRDVVVSEVRQHLLANGVTVRTSQIPGSGRYIEPSAKALEKNPNLMIYAGTYTTRFTNIDDKTDFVEVTHEAQANDFGDKAPGKASTYAEKLNIIKGLMLETGIADESRNPGEGDGAAKGEAAKPASGEIRAPKAKGEAAAEAAPAEPASKGLVAQVKKKAEAKKVVDKIEANFTAKGASWETLSKQQAADLQKWIDAQPDPAE